MSEGLTRVLIVEDRAEDRGVYKKHLAGASDFDVSEAGSGEEGLSACKAKAPDCLVVSHDLSDVDGLKFLDGLANEAGDVTIPVIMLLSKDRRMTVSKVLGAGAQDYLVKSEVTASMLVRAVRHAVELKQISNRYERQRDIFRAILNANPGFLTLKDAGHTYQAVNPVFCEFLGADAGAIVGKSDTDLFPPDEAAATEALEDALSDSDGPSIQEQELTGKEGKRWFKVSRSAIRNSAGHVVGLLSEAHDITESRELREKVGALSEGEDRVREVERQLEASRSGKEELEARVAAAEKRAAAAEGQLAAAQGASKTLEERVSAAEDEALAAQDSAKAEEDRANAAENRLAAAQEASKTLEERVSAAENQAVAAQDAAKAEEDRANAAENRLSEAREAAREETERFEQVAGLIPSALCQVGPDTKVTYFNPAAFALLGYEPGDVEGGVNLGDLFHGDERGRVAQGIKDSAQGKSAGPTDYRMLRKDGAEIAARVNSAPIIEDGKIVGLYFVMTDAGPDERAVAAARVAGTALAAAAAARTLGGLVTALLDRAGEHALPDEALLEELRETVERCGDLAEKLGGAKGS